MTALGAPRNVARYGDSNLPDLFKLPVADNVKIYQGALVVKDSAGRAKPAVTATGLIAVGIALKDYDNTVAGHAAGAFDVEIRAGVFPFVNSASGEALAQADVFNTCYAVDDQTVSKTDGSGAQSAAGKVTLVNEGGDGLVWVHVSPY